jgi:hypothetical protein
LFLPDTSLDNRIFGLSTRTQWFYPRLRVSIVEIRYREALDGRAVNNSVDSTAENVIANALEKIANNNDKGAWYWWNWNEMAIVIKNFESCYWGQLSQDSEHYI